MNTPSAAGAKELYLVLTDAGDEISCDWGDWAEPRLIDTTGKETKLTDLKWKSASAGFNSTRARMLWLLGKIEGKGKSAIAAALADKDADLRIVGLRLARQLPDADVLAVVKKLASDESPQVRRECAIALRHTQTADAAALWAELALKHDGKDRWYLEALGLASDLNADACLAAYLAKAGGKPAGYNDLIWRVRAKAALPLLVKNIKDQNTTAADKDRYIQAFDFHPKSAEKDAALVEIATGGL